MSALRPQYDPAEFAHRGEALYASRIAPTLGPADRGNFVAIDIDSGDFELDEDDFAATERLLKRHTGAQIWLVRVGDRAAYRLGAHGHRTERP